MAKLPKKPENADDEAVGATEKRKSFSGDIQENVVRVGVDQLSDALTVLGSIPIARVRNMLGEFAEVIPDDDAVDLRFVGDQSVRAAVRCKIEAHKVDKARSPFLLPIRRVQEILNRVRSTCANVEILVGESGVFIRAGKTEARIQTPADFDGAYGFEFKREIDAVGAAVEVDSSMLADACRKARIDAETDAKYDTQSLHIRVAGADATNIEVVAADRNKMISVKVPCTVLDFRPEPNARDPKMGVRASVYSSSARALSSIAAKVKGKIRFEFSPNVFQLIGDDATCLMPTTVANSVPFWRLTAALPDTVTMSAPAKDLKDMVGIVMTAVSEESIGVIVEGDMDDLSMRASSQVKGSAASEIVCNVPKRFKINLNCECLRSFLGIFHDDDIIEMRIDSEGRVAYLRSETSNALALIASLD